MDPSTKPDLLALLVMAPLLLLAACVDGDADVVPDDTSSRVESTEPARLASVTAHKAACDPQREPYGLIGDEWRRLGAGNGALGCSLTPERDHPDGRGGRVQTFERGQIVWSPQTAPRSVQVGYVRDGTLHYHWTDTSPYSYDAFLVTWDKDGARLGQRDLPGGRSGSFSVHVGDGFGSYRLAMLGCDRGVTGSTCRQGWTLPLVVEHRYSPANTCAGRPVPYGLIGERWRAMRSGDGPLGCAITTELDHPSGRGGRVQTFERGQMVWSPQVWGHSVQVGYVDGGGVLRYEWSNTAPFSYDTFLVVWDKNDVRIGQSEANGFSSHGSWSLPVGDAFGRYTMSVEGCDTDVTGSTCRQGWTLPLTVDHAYAPAESCSGHPVPYGLIGDRWRGLRAGDGPLGCPVTEEMNHPEGRGRLQLFERGSIGWSPDTGPHSVQAAWLDGSVVHFDWGTTLPFTFDLFHVRLDRDGRHLLQNDAGTGSGGHWSLRLERGGIHRLVVQGCDTGVSDDCRAWSNPLYVVYDPRGTGYLPPQPTRPRRPLPYGTGEACPGVPAPAGLYRREWMRLGGPFGPMGCPLSGVKPLDDGRRGGIIQFQNGQIAQALDVWPRGVLAAYNDGRSAIIDWSSDFDDEPHNKNYDIFVVRWNRDSVFDDQDDIVADMTDGQVITTAHVPDTHLRTHGTHVVPMGETRSLEVLLKGCDVPQIGGSTCDDWMPALVVSRAEREPINAVQAALDHAKDDIDLAGLTPPTSPADAAAMREDLVARAVLESACRTLPWTMYRNEGDYPTIIAAKLAFSDYWQGDRCPGRDESNRAEAAAALRKQRVESATGTSFEHDLFLFELWRTGEYDVALAGLIQIVYRYWYVLPLDVREHVIDELLVKRGPIEASDFSVIDIAVPDGPPQTGVFGDVADGLRLVETENHTLNIVTSRYLTNQILFARTGEDRYDNARNGVGSTLLAMLNHLLRNDFVEYNARPYQDYALGAILNLYHYTSEGGHSGQVKLAAQMVLDYVSAKLAASMNDARRVAPFRRRVSHFISTEGDRVLPHGRDLYGGNFDPATPLAAMLGGLPGELGASAARSFSYFWLRLGLGDYQAPAQVQEWLLPGAKRSYVQAFHHHTDELYAGSPSFLLSAGGRYASYAYTLAGQGADDDIGLAVPTTLLPTGHGWSVNDLLRFEGAASHEQRFNMCVAPGFACGLEPRLPEAYVARDKTHCYARATDGGALLGEAERGQLGLAADDAVPWTFLDMSGTDCNPAGGGHDYYVAFYRRGDHGFFEAYDLTHRHDPGFAGFVATVVRDNPAARFHRDGENRYRSSDGRAIDFVFQRDSRVLRVDGAPGASSASGQAAGDVIAGAGGRLRIRGHFGRPDLVLDGTDRFAPRRYEAEPEPGTSVDVVIDKNGFLNLDDAWVTGPGLAGPVRMGAGAEPVPLWGLQPGATYWVDFLSTSGPGASDFGFSIDAAGRGIASVGRSLGGQTMVVDFVPGATTLVLRTQDIVYNANSGQTGYYYVRSATGWVPQNSGPIRIKVLPGVVQVDNLYNTGANNEDFAFFVDENGACSSWGGYEEYATFAGPSVSPRAVRVHFRVEASGPLSPLDTAYTQPVTGWVSSGNTHELDILMTPGNAGLLFPDFGAHTIDGGEATKPDGTPWLGTTRSNDYLFAPRLRWDQARGFFWEGSDGGVISGSASGFYDDGVRPLRVSVTATIMP